MKTTNSDGMKKQLIFLITRMCIFMLALAYSPMTFAATYMGNKSSLQGYMVLALTFMNNVIIPMLFTIALLFFLVHAARFFILGGDNEEGQDKAKRLALYGIVGFVLMVSIWGIVNMLTSGLGFNRSNYICADYLCENGSYNGGYNNGYGSIDGSINAGFDLKIYPF